LPQAVKAVVDYVHRDRLQWASITSPTYSHASDHGDNLTTAAALEPRRSRRVELQLAGSRLKSDTS